MFDSLRDPELIYYMVYQDNGFVCKFTFRNPVSMVLNDVYKAEEKYADRLQGFTIKKRFKIVPQGMCRQTFRVLPLKIVELSNSAPDIDNVCMYIVAVGEGCDDFYAGISTGERAKALDEAATNNDGIAVPEYKEEEFF
ncbi:hypothetical protein IW152_000703 [Coemansia sp. BCRC 34962]|nr:hypothetical protein IW152_000703 [Coemansia sp. BCRC 34962]